MAGWGINILDEDCAADVYASFVVLFNSGQAVDVIVEQLRRDYAEALADDDDAPSVWLGLAKAQWERGVLDEKVFAEVRRLIAERVGLQRWAESGERALRARERGLQAFVAKLAEPNLKPKKRRKATKLKAAFEAGDCLAIKLDDGEFAAAIVTAAPEGNATPGAASYGINVIAQLDYKSPSKPTAEVFERRDYLMLTYDGCRRGMNVAKVYRSEFRAFQDRFEVRGKTILRANDPVGQTSVHGWAFAEQIRKQRSWQAMKDRL